MCRSPLGLLDKKAAGKPALMPELELELELPPRPVDPTTPSSWPGGRYGSYLQHSISPEEILGPVPWSMRSPRQ